MASIFGLALALGGCGYVSFARRMSDQELLLRSDVRAYYSAVQLAFAVGNPQGLTALFSPSITHPMSYAEIEAWARKFFSENKSAHFRVLRLDIEEIGPAQAVVALTYKVETRDGKGDFGGTERDTLVREKGRWLTSAWDKLPR